MAGGKSRAMCEQAFDYALDYPGILIPLFRQEHTSIVRSTRRTMLEQVIPPELQAGCDSKNSQGEDWVRLPNGSELHFAGLQRSVALVLRRRSARCSSTRRRRCRRTTLSG